METLNTKPSALQVAKFLSNRKREIAVKWNNNKAINYKRIVEICKELNEMVGYEVIAVSLHEGELHNYKMSNRLRYADTYQKGTFMSFECKVAMGMNFEGHTKKTLNAWNLTAHFYNIVLESPLNFAKAIVDKINA